MVKISEAQRKINDENQVISLDEIAVGKKYRKINLDSSGNIFIQRDFEVIDSTTAFEGTIRVRYLHDGFETGLSLIDYGVLPYMDRANFKGERWNSRNYLVPIE